MDYAVGKVIEKIARSLLCGFIFVKLFVAFTAEVEVPYEE